MPNIPNKKINFNWQSQQKELISSNYLSERFGTINHLKTPSNQIKEGDIDLIESVWDNHLQIMYLFNIYLDLLSGEI